LVPGVFRGVYRGRGDHSLKLARVGRRRRDEGKFSFDNRTVREWNSLPQELVEIEKNGHLRCAINSYTVCQSGWSEGSTA
jgi:hypothetical protein